MVYEAVRENLGALLEEASQQGRGLPREVEHANPRTLICCAQYGQSGRNSAPHIGQSVNKLVSAGMKVTLTNPPGLYIQLPWQ